MKTILFIGAGLILLVAMLNLLPAQAALEPSRYIPAFSEVRADKGPVFKDGCLIFDDSVRSGNCVYGASDANQVVVVFGDSHALHWTPALLNIAEQRRWQIVALLRANCTSAQVDTDQICNRWRENSLKRIKALGPDRVILGTNTGPNVRVHNRVGNRLSRPASNRFLRRGMSKTIGDLLGNGARVTLIRDLILAPFEPSVCVAKNQLEPNRCAFRANRPEALSFDQQAGREFLQNRNFQIIDPLPKICPRRICSPVSGRYLKFRDSSHLSASYAATLDRWLGSALERSR